MHGKVQKITQSDFFFFNSSSQVKHAHILPVVLYTFNKVNMFAFHSSSALFFLPGSSSRTTTTASQRARDQIVTNAQQKSEQQQQQRKVDDDYNIEAGIEPCLVGYVDKDSNGVEMYCCEQPDGSMECRTMTPSHEECEIFDENGDVKVDCSPNLSVEQK